MVSLTYIQGASALVFSVFLVLHMINAALGVMGREAYDGFQEKARRLYQNPIGEAITIGSIVVHLGASFARWYQRPTGKSLPSETVSRKLHRYGGYFMACIIVPHIFATRLEEHSPDYSGLAYVCRHPLWRMMLIPYFMVYTVAGALHLFLGLPTAFKYIGWYKVGRRIQGVPMVLCCLAAIAAVEIGVAGIAGWIYPPNEDYSDHPFAQTYIKMEAQLWSYLQPYLSSKPWEF